MADSTTIVWFRQDLRLDDNPALAAAAARGRVVPVFVDTTAYQKKWPPGEARRWWLGRSLAGLDDALRALGSRLVVVEGDALENLLSLARQAGADAVFWNRRYEPTARAHDARVKGALGESGLEAASFNARLIREPWEVRNGSGGCYKVFTPYWRAVKDGFGDDPIDAPMTLQSPAKWPRSIPIAKLAGTASSSATARRLEMHWQPGEAGADALLRRLDAAFARAYPSGRDEPADDATSRLSPHLCFGELSPRRLLEALCAIADETHGLDVDAGVEAVTRQLVWRDFAYHLLYHFPETTDEPLRPEFANVAWRDDPGSLAAWTDGCTGYPIVDAGMRQLSATGWMHNRVRMLVGSFLCKDLLIHWRDGAAVFWDRLVDADLANNTFGWQWVAGCGADASPYFRIFNPVTQSKRFDADGAYVRRWVPELAALPTKYLHAPWTAPADVLADARVRLGHEYPRPMVDHDEARRRTLAAFEVLKSRKTRSQQNAKGRSR